MKPPPKPSFLARRDPAAPEPLAERIFWFAAGAAIALAAALSLVLGVITWLALALARTAAGTSVAASA